MTVRHLRTAKRVFSAATVAAAACLTVVPATFITSAPVASAAAAVCENFGGTFNWGIKESFRSYITEGAAKGEMTLLGDASDNGRTPSSDDYQIVFPVRINDVQAEDRSKGIIPLAGGVHFTGHGGTLDMEITNFRLDVDGSRVGVVVDYTSNEVEDLVPGATPSSVSRTDQTIVEFDLGQEFDFTNGIVTLDSTTSFTDGGYELFLKQPKYKAGESADAVAGEIGCGATGGVGSGGGSTGGGTSGSGKKSSGTLGFLKETTEYLNAMNNLLTSADKLITNTEKFTDRVTGGDKNSGGDKKATGGTGGGGAGGGTGGGTGVGGAKPGGGAGGGAAGGGGGAGNAPAAGGGGGAAAGGGAVAGASGTDVCTASDSLGVQQAQASWGVKQSFQAYITGSIAKGSWSLSGVDHGNGEFHFAGNSGAVDKEKGTGSVYFPGSMHFTGHDGLLNLKISDLEIQWSGGSGSLIAEVSSSDMEGNHSDYGRVALASLNFGSVDVTDSSASGTASAFLTSAGSAAFAEFYPEGTELDPVSFSATLGGEATCVAGQGAAASGGAGGGAAAAGGRAGVTAANAAKKTEKDKKNNAEKKTSGPGIAARLAGEGGDGDSEGYTNDGNFKIKNANASGYEKPSFTTSVLLILAAFVVAGGSLSQLVVRHPASR
ncbi:MAG: HtaA domain-containing protein [Corynebacterium sp.]|nr:HtaA domain-containing protein [Corynebacterium sp.]